MNDVLFHQACVRRALVKVLGVNGTYGSEELMKLTDDIGEDINTLTNYDPGIPTESPRPRM